jgi:hypothetical protein
MRRYIVLFVNNFKIAESNLKKKYWKIKMTMKGKKKKIEHNLFGDWKHCEINTAINIVSSRGGFG